MTKYNTFLMAALLLSVTTLTACGESTLSGTFSNPSDTAKNAALPGDENNSNSTSDPICNPIDGQTEGCEGPTTEEECVPNACGRCGDLPEEVCDGMDNDCDGEVDEEVTNACGGCGSLPEEICDGEDDDCDGEVDEGMACGDSCDPESPETCDGVDNDCDGEIDEGVTNACGGCGSLPEETCNGEDDDCDGEVDEGVTNACGACGDAPVETCDGVDNDCDGEVDEGVTNACGGCGSLPEETCDGEDNDCDGEVDEGFDADGNGVPDCQEAECVTLDFEFDAAGDALVAGQDASDAYLGWGVQIAVYDDAALDSPVPAIIFDSSNPTGEDEDLGTPNARYGGPGIGNGGASNTVALGNVLIVPEDLEDANGDGLVDDPDDLGNAAWYTFSFDTPVCLVSLDYVDGEESTIVQLFGEDGAQIAGFNPGGQGNNSVETVFLNTCGVSRLVIDMGGSGAIDNLKICPPEAICLNDAFTQYVATAAENHAVIVSNFEQEGDQVILEFQDNGRLTVNEDGTATVTGTLEVTQGGDIGEEWQFFAAFTGLGQGPDSGATPKIERPELQPQDVTDLWQYYRLVEGRITHDGATITLSERPESGVHPFQVGFAANNKNANYGGSFWFYTSRTDEGSSRTLDGHGDVNIDLASVCEPQDEGDDVPGTINTVTSNNGDDD